MRAFAGHRARTRWGRTGGLIATLVAALMLLAPAALAQGIQRPGAGLTRTAGPVIEGLYRIAGTHPDRTPYRGAAAILAQGPAYDIIWWIDKHVTHGVGGFEGAELVVDFGDIAPLRVTEGESGRLAGTWHNGEGTEVLTRFAPADAAPGAQPTGRYTVAGIRPDGGSYSGTATISRKDAGAAFDVEWSIAGQTNSGTALLDRGLLVVTWDDPSPAVYVLTADGGLKGLWADGAGEETMTPVSN